MSSNISVDYRIEGGHVDLLEVVGKFLCKNCQNSLGLRSKKTIMLRTQITLIRREEDGLSLILRCGKCKHMNTIGIEMDEKEFITKRKNHKISV